MDKYRSFSHPVQEIRPYFMELIKLKPIYRYGNKSEKKL